MALKCTYSVEVKQPWNWNEWILKQEDGEARNVLVLQKLNGINEINKITKIFIPISTITFRAIKKNVDVKAVAMVTRTTMMSKTTRTAAAAAPVADGTAIHLADMVTIRM